MKEFDIKIISNRWLFGSAHVPAAQFTHVSLVIRGCADDEEEFGYKLPSRFDSAKMKYMIFLSNENKHFITRNYARTWSTASTILNSTSKSISWSL